jgi:hypothetical protein
MEVLNFLSYLQPMMDNGKKENLTDMGNMLIKRIIDISVIFRMEKKLVKQ